MKAALGRELIVWNITCGKYEPTTFRHRFSLSTVSRLPPAFDVLEEGGQPLQANLGRDPQDRRRTRGYQ